MKTNLIILLLFIVFSSCGIGAGTLGGFDSIMFPVRKSVLVVAIDSLFAKYPEYRIPEKWKKEDDWTARGYDFLDSRIFYFKSIPEEMYYVSFVGDPQDTVQKYSSLSIRAVDNTSTYIWTKESDISSSEEKRMQKRFKDEIISKLEEYTHTKSAGE